MTSPDPDPVSAASAAAPPLRWGIIGTGLIADRFVDVFEHHLAPKDWKSDLDTARARELAATLARLQATARLVLVAALDASLARVGRERLALLVPVPPLAPRRRPRRDRGGQARAVRETVHHQRL